jgi:flagellar motor protein MotB
MRIPFFTFVSIIWLASCVSSRKYNDAQQHISQLTADSVLFEKRNRMLQDEINYLGTKSAAMEQALTQRLQEKEDSLNQKQQELKDRESSINDMKARKAEEREAFSKLSMSIIKAFSGFTSSEIATGSNCTQTVIEISDRVLFTPSTTKIDQSKAPKIASLIAGVMSKNIDLKLIVVNHTDSIYSSKERFEDNWALGAARANAVVRMLIRDYNIAPERIMPSTQAESIPLSRHNNALGRSRTAFLFYSELLPCIHSGE